MPKAKKHWASVRPLNLSAEMKETLNPSHLPPKPPGIHPRKKAPIPTAMKEQIWLRDCGKVFETKCLVSWCQNRINVWDFQAGHNIPESRGGSTSLENLIPICGRCNLSMGNRYTIDEWSKKGYVHSPNEQIKQEVPLAHLPSHRWWWCC
jgi:hypothetical protein